MAVSPGDCALHPLLAVIPVVAGNVGIEPGLGCRDLHAIDKIRTAAFQVILDADVVFTVFRHRPATDLAIRICAVIVIAIDARRRVDPNNPGWDVFVRGGRENTGLDAVTWAKEMAHRGAGELLITSMDADGTQAGYDLELTRTIAQQVEIPVIASGGAGTCEHIHEALTDGKAEAALLASLLHYGQLSIAQIKTHLQAHKVPVRGIKP